MRCGWRTMPIRVLDADGRGDRGRNPNRTGGGHDEPQLACPPNAGAPNSVKMGNSAVAVFRGGCVRGASLEAGPSNGVGRSSRSKSQFDTLILRCRR